MVDDLIKVGQKLGIRVERITIKAGEDCLVLRDKADNICMVFVVSNGQCHNLHECVDPQDLKTATLLKFALLLKYADKLN